MNDVNTVDLDLLKHQKAVLVRHVATTKDNPKLLEGLLNLIDYVQDCLEDDGTCSLVRES